jgi:hypothetical protein
MVPVPLPVAPLVIVTQDAFTNAVHEHPCRVSIETSTDPPTAGTLDEVAGSEYVQTPGA